MSSKTSAGTSVAAVIVTGAALVVAAVALVSGDWPIAGSGRAEGRGVTVYASHTNRGSIYVTLEVRSNLRGIVEAIGPEDHWFPSRFERRYTLSGPGEVLSIRVNAGVKYQKSPTDVVTCRIEADGEEVADDRHVKSGDTEVPDVTCLGTVTYAP